MERSGFPSDQQVLGTLLAHFLFRHPAFAVSDRRAAMSLGTDSFDARFAVRLVAAPPLRVSSSKLPDSRCSVWGVSCRLTLPSAAMKSGSPPHHGEVGASEAPSERKWERHPAVAAQVDRPTRGSPSHTHLESFQRLSPPGDPSMGVCRTFLEGVGA